MGGSRGGQRAMNKVIYKEQTSPEKSSLEDDFLNHL